jgi:trimethylamine---corrinoid protein Co-methyltransferase
MFESSTRAQVFTEDQLDLIHDRAMTILEEIGTEMRHDHALDLLKKAGQKVDGTRVRWDREFVQEMVEKAPETFQVRTRNPERQITLGGGSLVLTPVGGSPFCSDLERGRREGSMRDYHELVKMTQAADLLTCQQSGVVEASDLDDRSRHMEMDYAVIRYSDKPFICYGTSGPKARDAVNLAAIANGGREAIEQTPGMMGVVNPNSPLVWDWLMADALIEWAQALQPVVITPFLLAGATAPVSIAGGLAQQTAEALSGVALAQTVRSGAPCVFGSFFSAVDMRTGGPSFGTPESVLGCIAGGQLARRYKIPFRGGGGLCTGNTLDAQAASESLNSLWATFMAGSDLAMHAAGWLEGGLTASYEKFALDLEVLRMFVGLRDGIGLSEEEFALDAIREEGPGGMFLGSMHTLEHFRDWVFMSPLFKSQAYVTWEKQGAPTAYESATAEWKSLLERYEDPGIDSAVDEELREYITRRTAEIEATA